MFWAKRLKVEQGTSSWVLPYSDLVTLLLAVFVMIAAMGDLRAGDRFHRVSGAVRSAFGSRAAAMVQQPAVAPRPPTLLERLEAAGFAPRSKVRLIGPDDRTLAPCDLIIDQERVLIRVTGQIAFKRFSAALEPDAERAIQRIAEILADGRNRIEVRGHNGDGPPPATVPFRDGLDLSYARARAAAAVLVAKGVGRERVCVTAWDDSDPLERLGKPALPPASAAAAADLNSRIEIVVHAAMPAGHAIEFAEKDRVGNG